VSECDREASIMRTTWIGGGCSGMANVLQIAIQIISNFSNIQQNTLQISLLILDRWRRCSLQLFYRTLDVVDIISVSVSNRSDTVQLYRQFNCTNTHTHTHTHTHCLWRRYFCTRQICELTFQTTFENTLYYTPHFMSIRCKIQQSTPRLQRTSLQ